MQEIRIILDDRLAGIGDTRSVQGHLDATSYVLGDHEFSIPQGIDYDVVLTHVGEGILCTGVAHCVALGTCDRCLEEARLELSAQVEEYYLFAEPAREVAEQDGDELDYRLVEDDHTIELGESLHAALLMETPYVVLCRQDCRGLCPVCGENLNERDCGHAALLEQQRLDASPFAVLRQLDLDSREE
jgi:uncharacterized protein